jgi:hypothetical protein
MTPKAGYFARVCKVLGVIPFLVAIGMRLSTRGHYYREPAQRLLQVVDAAVAA